MHQPGAIVGILYSYLCTIEVRECIVGDTSLPNKIKELGHKVNAKHEGMATRTSFGSPPTPRGAGALLLVHVPSNISSTNSHNWPTVPVGVPCAMGTSLCVMPKAFWQQLCKAAGVCYCRLRQCLLGTLKG